MTSKWIFTALLGSITVGAMAQPVIHDGIVTDPAGRTLYVFDKDQPNASHCAGPCLQAWPAYAAEPAQGVKLLAQATRFASGGAQQWAWKGRPLYYFVGDAKPGDRAGDGSGGVWHIVKPASQTATAPAVNAQQATVPTTSAATTATAQGSGY